MTMLKQRGMGLGVETPATMSRDSQAGAGLTVEVLYPEFGNQAGANGNEMYLRACLPGARFVDTQYDDEPAFARERVSLVVMGGMSEFQQEIVIKRLRPWRDALAACVERGVPMLFCGNAPEILGRAIIHPDGSRVEGLGILDCVARQETPKRITGLFAGVFEPGEGAAPIRIAGFKAQFTQVEGDNARCGFCAVKNGFGLAEGGTVEGYRKRNLIATWLIGPVLPENPPLTRWLLDAMGAAAAPLAFEDVAMRAYEARVKAAFAPGAEMV